MGEISQNTPAHEDPWADTDEATSEFDRSRENREWEKLSEQFFNAGYREGIAAGKESVIQASFDEGYAAYGAPIGRTIGGLRGVAAAAIAMMGSRRPSSSEGPETKAIEELKRLKTELDVLKFDAKFPEGCEHDHTTGPTDLKGRDDKTKSSASWNVVAQTENVKKLQELQEQLRLVLHDTQLDGVVITSS